MQNIPSHPIPFSIVHFLNVFILTLSDISTGFSPVVSLSCSAIVLVDCKLLSHQEHLKGFSSSMYTCVWSAGTSWPCLINGFWQILHLYRLPAITAQLVAPAVAQLKVCLLTASPESSDVAEFVAGSLAPADAAAWVQCVCGPGAYLGFYQQQRLKTHKRRMRQRAHNVWLSGGVDHSSNTGATYLLAEK